MSRAMKLGPRGLALIKEFETFVPFTYDDMRPVRGARYGYRPYEGGEVRGTLTIGYGHTDAAKHPLKCTVGAVITELEADHILDVDLDECEADVNRLVKVPLTQNQFDALVSFQFNYGRLATSTLLKLLNRGLHDRVPGELKKFVNSMGQHLDGLVRRRDAEVALWTRPDDAAHDELPPHEAPSGSPVPDAPEAPKPMAQSKTLWGAVLAFLGLVGQQASQLSEKLGLYLSVLPPWATDLFVVLILLGILGAVYGRLDLRREHGV